jgi:hypothetical protein
MGALANTVKVANEVEKEKPVARNTTGLMSLPMILRDLENTDFTVTPSSDRITQQSMWVKLPGTSTISWKAKDPPKTPQLQLI